MKSREPPVNGVFGQMKAPVSVEDQPAHQQHQVRLYHQPPLLHQVMVNLALAYRPTPQGQATAPDNSYKMWAININVILLVGVLLPQLGRMSRVSGNIGKTLGHSLVLVRMEIQPRHKRPFRQHQPIRQFHQRQRLHQMAPHQHQPTPLCPQRQPPHQMAAHQPVPYNQHQQGKCLWVTGKRGMVVMFIPEWDIFQSQNLIQTST